MQGWKGSGRGLKMVGLQEGDVVTEMWLQSCSCSKWREEVVSYLGKTGSKPIRTVNRKCDYTEWLGE
jgi:hypothetical protein